MAAGDEIHSIIIAHRGNPAEIQLSRHYAAAFQEQTVQAVPQATMSLLATKNPRVRSFTTLFGENGSGKTQLLINIAQTFNDNEKGHPLGVLYSRDGHLNLHRGSVLADWRFAQEEAAGKRMPPPRIPTIFYTTSPFESSRRAYLERMGVLDVSPNFGPGGSFDGLALILNQHHLSGAGTTICRELRLKVRGKVSRERVPLALISDLLDRSAYDPEGTLLDFAKNMCGQWLETMPDADEQNLLANLIILSDIPGNHNVTGKFVGDLMRLATNVREVGLHQGISDWRSLVQLVEDVIRESRFIPFNGAQVIACLRNFKATLGSKSKGPNFTLTATPARLRQAIDQVEQQTAGILRFMVDLGFLEFKLKDLSSGESAFLHLYAAIGSAMERLAAQAHSGPILLLIDEGEMFLHPGWQREYIRNILGFVEHCCPTGAHVHICISTHSLIVAADAPPHSLFNVQLGLKYNGFGLGPEATLSSIYGVEQFSGENTAGMIAELVDFLSDPKQAATPRLCELADNVADQDLKAYLETAIRKRQGISHAEAE